MRRTSSNPCSASFPRKRDLQTTYANLTAAYHAAAAMEPDPAKRNRYLHDGLYAATAALDRITAVRDEEPDNDHALYMLAVAHAQRGDLTEAVAHLERAIALNSENRALAARDSRNITPA
jgi:tetratricopeptide (TPR) repeat protein